MDTKKRGVCKTYKEGQENTHLRTGWLEKGWLEKGWLETGWLEKGWLEKGWLEKGYLEKRVLLEFFIKSCNNFTLSM